MGMETASKTRLQISPQAQPNTHYLGRGTMNGGDSRTSCFTQDWDLISTIGGLTDILRAPKLGITQTPDMKYLIIPAYSACGPLKRVLPGCRLGSTGAQNNDLDPAATWRRSLVITTSADGDQYYRRRLDRLAQVGIRMCTKQKLSASSNGAPARQAKGLPIQVWTTGYRFIPFLTAASSTLNLLANYRWILTLTWAFGTFWICQA